MSYRKALEQKLLELPKNLNEESSRYWGLIRSNHKSMDHLQKVAQAAQALSLKEMQAFYRLLLLDPKRMELSTQAWGQQHPLQGKALNPKRIKGTRKHFPPLVAYQKAQ